MESDGSKVGGAQPGGTVYSVLSKASSLFEPLGDGMFVWK